MSETSGQKRGKISVIICYQITGGTLSSTALLTHSLPSSTRSPSLLFYVLWQSFACEKELTSQVHLLQSMSSSKLSIRDVIDDLSTSLWNPSIYLDPIGDINALKTFLYFAEFLDKHEEMRLFLNHEWSPQNSTFFSWFQGVTRSSTSVSIVARSFFILQWNLSEKKGEWQSQRDWLFKPVHHLSQPVSFISGRNDWVWKWRKEKTKILLYWLLTYVVWKKMNESFYRYPIFRIGRKRQEDHEWQERERKKEKNENK